MNGLGSDYVMVAEGVSKKFCRNLQQSLRHGLRNLVRSAAGLRTNHAVLRANEFWAVEDVSFALKPGDNLGIIGPNGAGKSTLLRVLNGIYPPDAGRVGLSGRIGGLIALGVGFHPHESGRNNIHINGAVLGMNRQEIAAKMDSIIEFAELGDFIDAPVSTYSSGMYVRLGFAIAIHCEPDILLIDEVLAVGDLSFQNKCFGKLNELRAKARAIIFIGHNMDYIQRACTRALLMHEGRVKVAGDPQDVIAAYRQLSHEAELAAGKTGVLGTVQSESIVFLDAGILDSAGNRTDRLAFGQDLCVFYEFVSKVDIEVPLFGVGFTHPRIAPWNVAYDSNIARKDIVLAPIRKDRKTRLTVRFKRPPLIPGVYSLNIMLKEGHTHQILSHINKYERGRFHIEPAEVGRFLAEGKAESYNSVVLLDSEWDLLEV